MDNDRRHCQAIFPKCNANPVGACAIANDDIATISVRTTKLDAPRRTTSAIEADIKSATVPHERAEPWSNSTVNPYLTAGNCNTPQ